MKCKQVLKLLQITRPTLSHYVKNGKIKASMQINGQYVYDDESVYKALNKDLKRQSVIYCRVSTQKQKKSLQKQKEQLESYCYSKGITINNVYQDIGSGLNFDRKGFQNLIDDIINHKVAQVFITYKDRLSRVSFDMFKNVFKNFNCEIIVMNDVDDNKTIEKEIFSEIISLIHCFTMKMYSSRRKTKMKIFEEELKLEDEIEKIDENDKNVNSYTKKKSK